MKMLKMIGIFLSLLNFSNNYCAAIQTFELHIMINWEVLTLYFPVDDTRIARIRPLMLEQLKKLNKIHFTASEHDLILKRTNMNGLDVLDEHDILDIHNLPDIIIAECIYSKPSCIIL